MELTAKTAKLSSDADKFHWGGSFTENDLFVLLEAEGDEEHPAIDNGKQILEVLLTKLTDFRERNLATIEKALAELEDNKHLSTVIIGLLEGNILYLGGSGQGLVFIQRQKKTGLILSGGEASRGAVASGDTLLFCSKRLEEVVNVEKIRELLQKKTLEEITKTVAPFLSGDEKIYGTAMIAVSIVATKEDKYSFGFLARVYQLRFFKLKTLWQKAKETVLEKMKISSQSTEEVKTKKTLLTVSAVLILLLVISIFFNLEHNRTRGNQQKLQETFTLVSHQYEEANSLIDINPVRSRELLSSAKLGLSPLLSQFPKNSAEYREVNEWVEKVSAAEVAAYKIFKLTAVPLFFDINFIKQGGQGDKISAYDKRVAILDSKNNVVYHLSTTNKQSSIIAGSDIVKDGGSIAIHGDNIYILNNDGVVGINIKSKESRVVIKKDEAWGEITSIMAFGGNLYFLDKGKHTIWKYIGSSSGFSGRYSYLNPDVRADFSKSIKMVVDGSVYVLFQGGEVLKFTKGLGEQFAFKGLADTLLDIADFYTSDTERNLYLLDKNNQRILVFDKDGNYQSQYQWDELKNASCLLVSEEEKKIFVISGSKIYAIDIK